MNLLSGLRNQLARSGVHVVTVKPGFVRTRMTDGMDLPARLTAGPDGLLRWLSRPFPSAAMWCTCGGSALYQSCPPRHPKRFFKRMKVEPHQRSLRSHAFSFFFQHLSNHHYFLPVVEGPVGSPTCSKTRSVIPSAGTCR